MGVDDTVLGAAGVTETGGLGLCFLGFGLGLGFSEALTGANSETSSTLILCEALACVTVSATGVAGGGVAARAGVSWWTARDTKNAAPNAATMQMMAVPANRTVK